VNAPSKPGKRGAGLGGLVQNRVVAAGRFRDEDPAPTLGSYPQNSGAGRCRGRWARPLGELAWTKPYYDLCVMAAAAGLVVNQARRPVSRAADVSEQLRGVG
jgi:hypothetical protein